MLCDFDFDLPGELIAQNPLPRGLERLLVYQNGAVTDTKFNKIIDYLHSGDLLVLNDTKVVKSWLHGTIDDKKVSINLINKNSGGTGWQILGKPRKHLELGAKIVFDSDFYGIITAKNDLDTIEFNIAGHEFDKKLEQIGDIPLPPYIKRGAVATDSDTYQTVYAALPGSVAAPTAGLHFTDEILELLRQKGVQIAKVTLHVGGGTFLPVRVENIAEHRMHSEFYEINKTAAALINMARGDGRRIVAVGTTALRTLESAVAHCRGAIYPHSRTTDIFITPGYKFVAVDSLITNFHLPKSTLFMLVAAFVGGVGVAQEIYRHAVAEKYRFFSYGDCCFFDKCDL